MFEQIVFADLQTMLKPDSRSPLKGNDRIAIYGAGGRGIELYKALREKRPDLQVLFFIDTFATGKVENLDIYTINNLPDSISIDLKIVVASMYWLEIASKLFENGFVNHIVYEPYIIKENFDFNSFQLENMDKNFQEDARNSGNGVPGLTNIFREQDNENPMSCDFLDKTHELVNLLSAAPKNGDAVTHEYVLQCLCKRFYNLPERRVLLLERILKKQPEIRIELLHVLKHPEIALDDLCAALIHRLCDSEKKTIALFYHFDMFSQIGEDFVMRLSQQGYNCLFLSTATLFDLLDFLLPVDKEIIIRLDMISMTIGFNLPLWIVWGNGWMSKIKSIDINRSARDMFYDKMYNIELLTRGHYVVRPVDASIKLSKAQNLFGSLCVSDS